MNLGRAVPVVVNKLSSHSTLATFPRVSKAEKVEFRVVPYVAGSIEPLALDKYVKVAFLSYFSVHECRVTNVHLATCIVQYVSLHLYFQLQHCK